jgi:hypothetical protein
VSSLSLAKRRTNTRRDRPDNGGGWITPTWMGVLIRVDYTRRCLGSDILYVDQRRCEKMAINEFSVGIEGKLLKGLDRGSHKERTIVLLSHDICQSDVI